MSSFHNTLGIKKFASKAEIKSAYRKLAKEFHPDRNKSPDAKERFIEIHEAYEVLYEGKLIKKSKSQPKKEDYRAKYWHVYAPPSNPYEREKWNQINEDRKQYYRNRAKTQAEKGYSNFKKESEAFMDSIYYYPLFALYIIVQIICTAAVLSTLILPYLGKYINPEEYINKEPENPSFFIIIFIAPVTFSLLYALRAIKKIIDPYFKNN